jgi:hypothetical protein
MHPKVILTAYLTTNRHLSDHMLASDESLSTLTHRRMFPSWRCGAVALTRRSLFLGRTPCGFSGSNCSLCLRSSLQLLPALCSRLCCLCLGCRSPCSYRSAHTLTNVGIEPAKCTGTLPRSAAHLELASIHLATAAVNASWAAAHRCAVLSSQVLRAAVNTGDAG